MRHRKTRTRLIIGLGLAAIMAVMSGASIAQAQPAQITMWDIPESDPYTAWWQEYVDEWNAANPDVQVKMEVFPTEEYKTKYVAALASDTLPDIFYGIPGPATQQAWKDGRIKSLDGLLDADRFAEGALSSCSFDGQVVCMPLYLGAEFVYYNKDHFAQAGIEVDSWANPLQPTWEEFSAAAEALKEAGIPPIALGNKDDWPGIQWVWAFQSRFGGNEAFYGAVSGENGGSYSDPSILKAAEYTQQLAENGWLTPGFNGIGGADKYTLWTQGRGAIDLPGAMAARLYHGHGARGLRLRLLRVPQLPRRGSGIPGSGNGWY